jgi:hypothetical protein
MFSRVYGKVAQMTLTSNLLDQRSPQKKWETENLAIIGAVSGLIAGSAYELSEVFLHDPSEIEPFLQIMAEVGAATLSGAFMFAVFSTIRNRLK